MKIISKYLAYFVTAATIIATAIIYPTLPDKIPMHWNINGAIDSYGAKWQAFMMPVIMLIAIIIMKAAPYIDPKKENYKKFQEYYNILIIAFSIFFSIMQAIILKTAFEPNSVSMNTVMPMLIGLLFSVIGLLFPKFEHNYFAGIRVPWTLADPENWTATHKFAGTLWVIGGLLIFATSFFPKKGPFLIALPIILIMSFVPMIYSYLLYRKSSKRN